MAEEWVDHSLGQAREAEGKLGVAKSTHEQTNKKLKETLSQLTAVEKSWKSADTALASYEKQAAESLKA